VGDELRAEHLGALPVRVLHPVVRVVEVLRRFNNPRRQRARVRHQRVPEAVQAHVGVGVRRFGRAQQRQPHLVAMDRVAVLAVVQQGNAVVPVAQVREPVRVHLELRGVPRSVEVGRPPLHAEARFVAREVVHNVHGELDLQELVRLVPVHVRRELDVGGMQNDALVDLRLAELPHELGAHVVALLPLLRAKHVELLGRVLLGVPGREVQRLVLEQQELVANTAFLQHLAVGMLVPN